MQKIATPHSHSSAQESAKNSAQSSAIEIGPSKEAVEFVRMFARSCVAIPTSAPSMGFMVAN